MRKTALILLALATFLAVTVVPAVPVLAIEGENRAALLPLDEGEAYSYEYINSIYRSSVEERHYRAGDALHVESAASPEIKAVEYFRWAGDPRLVGGLYEQRAPANTQQQLRIQVMAAYQQRLVSPRWSVDLGREFGDGLVLVSPRRLPLAIAAWRGWRP
jgi:hypothetical protein